MEPAWLVAGVALTGVVLLASALSRARRAAADAQARVTGLEQQLAQAHRLAQQAETEGRFYSGFLSELPHLARELHSGLGERRLPAVLLNVVMRSLQPEWALVLMRRRAIAEDGQDELVAVAAAPADGPAKTGTLVRMGAGELGFVAEVQRTLTRADFDTQAPPTRRRLRAEGLPAANPEIAAPMVFGEETVGVLAVGPLPHRTNEGKQALRLIAQLGALALHDVTAFSEMKVTADVDGLTRVFNKRHVTRALAEAIVKAEQDISRVSVFLFDLDHFKHYNDTNGHVAGDRLLRALARMVQDSTRREDVFGRFGGEEFVLVMPGADAAQALAAAEAIRTRIAAHPFPHAGGQPLGCLSVSGGVAEYPTDAQDSTHLLQAADRALYDAKRAGRNRVLTAQTRYVGGDEPVQPTPEPDFDEVLQPVEDVGDKP